MRPIPQPPPLPDHAGNARERTKIHVLCMQADKWKVLFKERCKRDFKFFANHFAYAYLEQISSGSKEKPLVMFGFQEEMALDIVENVWRAINEEHFRWSAGADKARKMTATFTGLLIVLWFAMFHGVSSIVTSKTLEDVDVLEDMDSPFERLRWQIDMIYKDAPWLFPEEFDPESKEYSKARLIKFGNGGQISGKAPIGKAFRQARALIWLGDEFGFVPKDFEVFAASSATIKVRLLFSTPNGPQCLFSRLVHGEELDSTGAPIQFKLYELDWWRHPEYAEGLYMRHDGILSSPYFDAILATETKQTIARDYLRDHNEAVGGMIYGGVYRKHHSNDPNLGPDPYVKTIYRVWDPGVHFGIVWLQKDRWNRLLVLNELFMHHDEVPRGYTLLDTIAKRAIGITEELFPGYLIEDLGDPYASHIQTEQQKKPSFDLLQETHGIRVKSTYMKKIATQIRKDMRHDVLSDLMANDVEVTTDDGDVITTPQILVNNVRCPKTVRGFTGKYRFRVEDDGTVTDEVIKSHPTNEMMDCVGMGAIKLYNRNNKDNSQRLAAKREQKKQQKWRPTAARMRQTKYA